MASSPLLSDALPPALKGIQDDLVMEDMVFLVALMGWLEKTKKELGKGNEFQTASDGTAVAQSNIVNAAVKLLQWAESEDRAGHHNKDVVTAFYTAGILLDVDSVFGRKMNKDVTHQQKEYAKWRAAHLHNWLNSGGTPSVPAPKPGEGTKKADNLELFRPSLSSSEQSNNYQATVGHHPGRLQDAAVALPTSKCQASANEPAHSSSSGLTTDLKEVERFLNLLTPSTFDKQLARFQTLNINAEERITEVLKLIFEKAVEKTRRFSIMYVNLCRAMSTNKGMVSANPFKSTNFGKLLVTQCQVEFEKGIAMHIQAEEKKKDMETCKDEKKKKLLEEELGDLVKRNRKRSLGFTRFIGELFNARLLSTKVIHQCVLRLLSQPEDEESLECLCLLLSTCGKTLDEAPIAQHQNGTNSSSLKSRETMNQYFRSLDAILQKGKISNEIRSMIQDVVDLRKNQWKRPPPRSEKNDRGNTTKVDMMTQPRMPRGPIVDDTQQDYRSVPDGPTKSASLEFLPPQDGYLDLSFGYSFQVRSSQDSLLVMGRRADKEVSSPTSTVVDLAVTTLASAVPHDDGENLSVTSKSTTLRSSNKDDQWSPGNPEGKKVYDRPFLLKFQNDPASLKMPDGINSSLEVVRNRNRKAASRKSVVPPSVVAVSQVAGVAPVQSQPGDMSNGSVKEQRQRSIALRIVDVNTNVNVLTGEEVPPSITPPTTAGPTDAAHGTGSTLTKSAFLPPKDGDRGRLITSIGTMRINQQIVMANAGPVGMQGRPTHGNYQAHTMANACDQDMIDIVVLNGTEPTMEKYPRSSLTKENDWEECPIPTMLGIPVMAKPIRPYPGGNFPDSQPAVFMMVEPVKGFAPARWQLGPRRNLGLIGLGRRDGVPFTIQEWSDLHNFIFGLMSFYSSGVGGMSNDTIARMINKDAFISYLFANHPTRPSKSYEPVYLCARLQCGKPAPSRCNRCHYTYYCSRTCQAADWIDHKKSCRKPFFKCEGEEEWFNNIRRTISSVNK